MTNLLNYANVYAEIAQLKMKPRHILLIVFCLIGIQQIFEYYDVFGGFEITQTVRLSCLAASFILLIYTCVTGATSRTDSNLPMIVFIIGGLITASATVCSAFAVMSFFYDSYPQLFKPINSNMVLSGSLIGQLCIIGAFALNDLEEEPHPKHVLYRD